MIWLDTKNVPSSSKARFFFCFRYGSIQMIRPKIAKKIT